jgi:hypothetical protein
MMVLVYFPRLEDLRKSDTTVTANVFGEGSLMTAAIVGTDIFSRFGDTSGYLT